MDTHYFKCAHYRLCIWAGSNNSTSRIYSQMGVFPRGCYFRFLDVERPGYQKMV